MVFELPSTTGNLTALAQYSNTVTNDSFWNLMLLAVMIALFSILSVRGTPKEESFFLVALMGVIISGLMAGLNLIDPAWIFGLVMLLAMSIVLLWRASEK